MALYVDSAMVQLWRKGGNCRRKVILTTPEGSMIEAESAEDAISVMRALK